MQNSWRVSLGYLSHTSPHILNISLSCSTTRTTEARGGGQTWVHTGHSNRRLGLSGFWTLRRGRLFPPIRCCPRPSKPVPSPPTSPWPWLSVSAAPQTVWGQRATQQPHIRHGSSPLCGCWMVNYPEMSLTECGSEFLQRMWKEGCTISKK